MLAAAVPTGPSLPTQSADSLVRPSANVGDRGVASTVLRPAGKAMIGAAFLDVTTDGDFIKTGTPVVVVRICGRSITVAAAKKSPAA